MDARQKITIELDPMPAPPREAPPRMCAVCQEQRRGWEFAHSSADICWDCAAGNFQHKDHRRRSRTAIPGRWHFGGAAENFWRRPGAFRDETLMNEALAVCRALEREAR